MNISPHAPHDLQGTTLTAALLGWPSSHQHLAADFLPARNNYWWLNSWTTQLASFKASPLCWRRCSRVLTVQLVRGGASVNPSHLNYLSMKDYPLHPSTKVFKSCSSWQSMSLLAALKNKNAKLCWAAIVAICLSAMSCFCISLKR